MKTFASLVTLAALLVTLMGCGSSTVEGQPSAVSSMPAATVTSPTTSVDDDSCRVQNAPTDSETATIIKPYTCSYGYTPQSGEMPSATCGFTKGWIELNADRLTELKTHRMHVPMEGPDGPFTIYVTDDMIAIVWMATKPSAVAINQQQAGLIRDPREDIPFTSHLLSKDWTGGIRDLQICF